MRNTLSGVMLAALLLVPALSLAEPPYPNPQRFAADIDAFSSADLQAMPTPGGVLCIGSSSMRFWHESMSSDLQPLTLIPRGFGGSTMLDVLYYSERIVVPYRPRAILVYEGDNDLEVGVSPERFLATVQQFLEVVRAALPDTRVYLMSVKPSPSRRRLWPQMQQANNQLRVLCDTDPRLHFIDVATPMLGADEQPRPELFLADNLHLNAQGYAVWTKAVRDGMVTAEAIWE
jgi:lysophospholipase L1-like esterase